MLETFPNLGCSKFSLISWIIWKVIFGFWRKIINKKSVFPWCVSDEIFLDHIVKTLMHFNLFSLLDINDTTSYWIVFYANQYMHLIPILSCLFNASIKLTFWVFCLNTEDFIIWFTAIKSPPPHTHTHTHFKKYLSCGKNIFVLNNSFTSPFLLLSLYP